MSTELEQARARGERFRLWFEQDGLRDVFADIRGAYADKIGRLDPLDKEIGDKARILAIARRVVEEVEAHVLAIMAGGVIANQEIEHLNRLERLNPRKRRFL